MFHYLVEDVSKIILVVVLVVVAVEREREREEVFGDFLVEMNF